MQQNNGQVPRYVMAAPAMPSGIPVRTANNNMVYVTAQGQVVQQPPLLQQQQQMVYYMPQQQQQPQFVYYQPTMAHPQQTQQPQMLIPVYAAPQPQQVAPQVIQPASLQSLALAQAKASATATATAPTGATTAPKQQCSNHPERACKKETGGCNKESCSSKKNKKSQLSAVNVVPDNLMFTLNGNQVSLTNVDPSLTLLGFVLFLSYYCDERLFTYLIISTRLLTNRSWTYWN